MKIKQPKKKKGPPLKLPAPLTSKFRFPREPEHDDSPIRRLTHIEELFVTEYIKDFNISRASDRCGMTHSECSKLLQEPHIRDRLDAITNLRSQKNIVEAEEILQFLREIFHADFNVAAETITYPCRRCWGYDTKEYAQSGNIILNGKYQFDDDEHRRAHKEKYNKYRWGDGGIGYDKKRAPNPRCNKCGGHGKSHTVQKDTNSYQVRRLIQSVRINSKGESEFTFFDRMEVFQLLMRHLGMFEKDNIQQQESTRIVVEGGMSPETHAQLMAFLPQLERQMQEDAARKMREVDEAALTIELENKNAEEDNASSPALPPT